MTRIAATAAAMVLLTVGANTQVGMTAIERQRLLSHLDMTSAWLVDDVSGLSDAQLTFKPSPDAWSIAQVLDHLVMVGPIYWNDLQQALATPPGDLVVRDTDADILRYGIDRTHREQAIATEIVIANRAFHAALCLLQQTDVRIHHRQLMVRLGGVRLELQRFFRTI